MIKKWWRSTVLLVMCAVAMSGVTSVTSFAAGLTGNPVVGETLTAEYTPGVYYKWYYGFSNHSMTNAYEIRGQGGNTYTVLPDDVDVFIGYATFTDELNHSAIVWTSQRVTGDETGATGKRLKSVAIKGDITVGSTLVAEVVPSMATVECTWRIGGYTESIKASTYTVKEADRGKSIEVSVQGIGDTKGSASRTYQFGQRQFTSVKIVGDTKVGNTLTAVVEPSDAIADYIWSWIDKDGTTGVIWDGTKDYILKSTDIGKRFDVKACGTGEFINAVYSSKTATVTSGEKQITSARIIGEPKAGNTLTAVVEPSDATVECTWYEYLDANKTIRRHLGVGPSYWVTYGYDGRNTIYVDVKGLEAYTNSMTAEISPTSTPPIPPTPPTPPINNNKLVDSTADNKNYGEGDIPMDNIYTGANKNTTVGATQSASYSILIPKLVSLSGNRGSANKATYGVRVKGDIPGNAKVTVIPENTFNMTSTGKTPITATVVQSKTEFKIADGMEKMQTVGIDSTGTIEVSGLTSGFWSGSFNFNIAYEKVA